MCSFFILVHLLVLVARYAFDIVDMTEQKRKLGSLLLEERAESVATQQWCWLKQGITIPADELVQRCSEAWARNPRSNSFRAVYMTQGIKQPELASTMGSGRDHMRLTFQPGHENLGDVHCPGVPMFMGRNVLLGLACVQEIVYDFAYAYYVFLDDDIHFAPHPTELSVCPPLWSVEGRKFTPVSQIAGHLDEFESLLQDLEPAVASPGRGRSHGAPEASTSAVATFAVTFFFVAVHRRAAFRLFPYVDTEDSSCPRTPEIYFNLQAASLYRSHVMLMGTSFEAIELDQGNYSHDCMFSNSWVNAYALAVDLFWPGMLENCVAPRREDVVKLQWFTDNCRNDTIHDELFAEGCKILDVLGSDYVWSPICLPWGEARSKPQHMDYAFVVHSEFCDSQDDGSYMRWLQSSSLPIFR